jgi:hypothetical protein
MSMLRSGATDGEGSCASRGCSRNERIGVAQGGYGDPYFGRHATAACADRITPIAKAFRSASKPIGRSIQKAAVKCTQLPTY